ncbi:unnamed protein product [Caenorhabditis brenneri]
MILEPEPEWFITLMSSQTYLCSISFLVNTFHLMILSQKSMRISSTNVLMIGIAICDLYNMFQPIFKTIDRLSIWTAIVSLDVCLVPNTYAEALFNWILYSICDDTKRCQCLLGIFLAFIYYTTNYIFGTSLLLPITSMFHFPIKFFISHQYRDTVYRILRIKIKTDPIVMVSVNGISPNT